MICAFKLSKKTFTPIFKTNVEVIYKIKQVYKIPIIIFHFVGLAMSHLNSVFLC